MKRETLAVGATGGTCGMHSVRILGFTPKPEAPRLGQPQRAEAKRDNNQAMAA